MQSLKFSCPLCGQHLFANEELFGTILSCPACSNEITVPYNEAAPIVPPEPPPTEILRDRDQGDSPLPPTTKLDTQSARPRKLEAIFAALFIGAFVFSQFSGGTAAKKSEKEVETVSQGARAEGVTQQVVSESLKAPSTAGFVDFRILDQNGPYFQTYIGVDAQNAFGAYIRSYFVCVFKLEDGGRFTRDKLSVVYEVESFDHGVIKGPSDPEKEMMDFQKSSLGWPGYNSNK